MKFPTEWKVIKLHGSKAPTRIELAKSIAKSIGKSLEEHLGTPTSLAKVF
jgi:hypothetical protein